MAYEKADFYAAYQMYAVDPVTGARYSKYRAPEFGDERITLVLHYHPHVMKANAAGKAQRLVDHFIAEGVPLTAADRVCVIGGAFGWLCESLEDLVPGLEAVSVDLSQYVQDVKGLSADDELIESIEAEGRAIDDGGIGQMLYERFSDSAPRSRDATKVVQEDLGSNRSRNEVRKALRNADPTRVITDEVWQILTQEEQDRYTAAAANWGVTLTHIINNVII